MLCYVRTKWVPPRSLERATKASSSNKPLVTEACEQSTSTDELISLCSAQPERAFLHAAWQQNLSPSRNRALTCASPIDRLEKGCSTAPLSETIVNATSASCLGCYTTQQLHNTDTDFALVLLYPGRKIMNDDVIRHFDKAHRVAGSNDYSWVIYEHASGVI